MPLRFCPECGSKLQLGFKFCPSCGEKLPCLPELQEATHSELAEEPEAVLKLSSRVQAHSITDVCANMSSASSSSPALIRSPIKTPCRSSARKSCSLSTPTKPAANKGNGPQHTHLIRPNLEDLMKSSRISDRSAVATLSPRKRKTTPETKEEEEQPPSVVFQSPQTPPTGKSKRTKRVSAVEPVQEGLELCDQSGKKWRVGKLLSQTEVELTYEAQQVGVRSSSNDSRHMLRLGAKDGQLFNEQNFLQRAAKPAAVEKWMKTHGLDFLGVPSSIGFGLHETYRFLVFPDMGCTLQSVMDTQTASLSERAVLQLALPLLDALQFIHENEYVHADIHAGNVYISRRGDSQVFLSGFGHAFRFCPGGNHVEYREGGRTPHQGNLNFISVDSHKGAGPSRRSDLQSLGFCLLFWLSGTLPWSPITQPGSAVCAQKEKYMADIPGLMRHCFPKKKVSGALQTYLSQVRSLQYTEKPDYSELKLGLQEQLSGSLGEPLTFR